MTDGIAFHENEAKRIREAHRRHDEWMRGINAVKEEAARAEEERKAADAAARAEAADKRFVSELKRRYMAADPKATEVDFLRDLPELRKQHRMAAVAGATTADDRARAQFIRQYRG